MVIGDVVGWEYDVVVEIVVCFNMKVVYENFSWDVMILVVLVGEYDVVMNGIIIKVDWVEKVDFFVFYMCLEMFMLVCVDEDWFFDLSGFVVNVDFLVGV